MSNQESENYLDQLLNSINHSKEEEDAFLAEFEKELEMDDMDVDFPLEDNDLDFVEQIKELEPEEISENDMELFEELPLSDMSLDNLLSSVGENISEENSSKDVPVEEHSSEEIEEDIVENVVEEFVEDVVEDVMEEVPQEENSIDNDLSIDDFEEPSIPLTEDGEGDLTGMKDDDLMALLESSSDFSDIGVILNEDGSLDPIDGIDSIDDFAQQEMEASSKAQDVENQPSESKKEGKEKKPGFFAKLKNALFGPDEEETLNITPSRPLDAATLSGENDEILAQLEQEGKQENSKKKQKKEKPKKEKKPKKPKVKDNTPPLPKGPVILIFLMAISLGVLIFLGATLLSYGNDIRNAREAYNVGDYVKAHDYIAGVSVKEKDEELYEKIILLSAIQSKVREFDSMLSQDKQLEALNAIIVAIGRCENYKEKAKEYGVEKELEKQYKAIETELQNKYAMSVEEAMAIYNQRGRKNYTYELQKKIKELGLN